MHGSRSKTPSKNLVRQRGTEGFNSGANGLRNKLPRNRKENTDMKNRIVILGNRKGMASYLVHKKPSNNSSIWIFI
jgi:ribosomal protein S15P/S13E